MGWGTGGQGYEGDRSKEKGEREKANEEKGIKGYGNDDNDHDNDDKDYNVFTGDSTGKEKGEQGGMGEWEGEGEGNPRKTPQRGASTRHHPSPERIRGSGQPQQPCITSLPLASPSLETYLSWDQKIFLLHSPMSLV